MSSAAGDIFCTRFPRTLTQILYNHIQINNRAHKVHVSDCVHHPRSQRMTMGATLMMLFGNYPTRRLDNNNVNLWIRVEKIVVTRGAERTKTNSQSHDGNAPRAEILFWQLNGEHVSRSANACSCTIILFSLKRRRNRADMYITTSEPSERFPWSKLHRAIKMSLLTSGSCWFLWKQNQKFSTWSHQRWKHSRKRVLIERLISSPWFVTTALLLARWSCDYQKLCAVCYGCLTWEKNCHYWAWKFSHLGPVKKYRLSKSIKYYYCLWGCFFLPIFIFFSQGWKKRLRFIILMLL